MSTGKHTFSVGLCLSTKFLVDKSIDKTMQALAGLINSHVHCPVFDRSAEHGSVKQNTGKSFRLSISVRTGTRRGQCSCSLVRA